MLEKNNLKRVDLTINFIRINNGNIKQKVLNNEKINLYNYNTAIHK